MEGPARKTFVIVVSVAVMLIGGCGGQESPNVKKGRALAAENIELRKQLEQRSAEIEKLTQRHGEEIKKQQSLLEKCEQEKLTWKTKAQQNIRDQVKGVLDTVVEENARLREENQAFKAQIEALQKESTQNKDPNK
jgi:regulator of replication initiation timing